MIAAADLQKAVAALLAGPSSPDRPYCRDGVTIGEVYAMAAWLRDRFAGQAERKVVCLAAEDRAVIAAAILASLAGGPILLLPYAFSGQALAGMQEATGFTTAISDVPRDFPEGIEIICPQAGDTGTLLQRFTAEPGTELLRLYTGGSTGMPQVWAKTGLNILGESLFLAGHFAVNDRDCIVATISPYHIYGLLYSVTLPLVSGAAVVPGTPSFPEEISRSVEKNGATMLVSVPAHYRVLRDRPGLGNGLRLAFSSAGMLEVEDNRGFCRHNPAGIVEVYGSTETGGLALRNRSRGEEQFTPYPTITWRIDDERLRIDSPYLSPNLPRQTGGWFLTGDRVETSGRGGFFLRGRYDSITKVAGKRVDLEEIAALVRRQPGVNECLVLALAEGGGRGHRIVAVVEGEAVDPEEVRRMLAARFEPYALPRAIKAVRRLPLKENGKYDRPAILALFES